MRILARAPGSQDWEVAQSVKAPEAGLQELLAESPLLIPIQEIREGVSPLVVAAQEFGLPGSGSTDVLAFSANGDIALVECKLAANPQSKREVIGQILEYAAFLWQMSYEEVNDRVQARKGQSLAEAVAGAVGPEWDEESFREGVVESLNNGAFMLIIVVDEINDELRRIIRYVNECSESAFSLHALELPRFRAAGVEVLVPHLHGVSTKKRPTTRGRWTEERFFDVLSQTIEQEHMPAVRDLYNWSRKAADRVSFGTGVETGSFTFHFLRGGNTVSVFSVYTDGRLTLNYGMLAIRVGQHTLQQLHDRVTEIGAFATIPPDFTKWPSIRIEDAVKTPQIIENFKSVIQWLGENISPEA